MPPFEPGMWVVLNWGMGVDSTAILVRWLLEAACRGFPLERLIVITAQVGGESLRTKWFGETFVLPLLRRFNIRLVQVCRAGPSQKHGIIVLSDTRQPDRLYTEGGPYTLEDELLAAGTVVVAQKNRRNCSQKHKAFPIETWLRKELKDDRFIQILGFASDELERVEKDESYSCIRWGEQKEAYYPLVEWGWDREKCIAYLLEVTGHQADRSCCVWCPFARSHIIACFRQEPASAVRAMRIEQTAVSLNQNSTIFPRNTSLIEAVKADGNVAAAELFEDYLRTATWALYRVQRVFTAPASADRKLTIVQTGTRSEIAAALAELAETLDKPIEERGDYRYLYLQRRPELPKKRRAPRKKKGEAPVPVIVGKGRKAKKRLTDAATEGIYPFTEDFYTIAPAEAQDKERDRFAAAWQQATSPVRQKSLLPLAA